MGTALVGAFMKMVVGKEVEVVSAEVGRRQDFRSFLSQAVIFPFDFANTMNCNLMPCSVMQ